MASGGSNSNTRVLVTGASGYIASHIVQQLQQQGYQVRGTVRSLKNELKSRPLYQLCPDAIVPLELVEADLTQERGWLQAVDGCQFVMHVASPVPNKKPRNENDVIRPAVDGTLNVLKACSKVKGIKCVVLTSSVAAITGGYPPGTQDESDWTDLSLPNIDAYTNSKILAERAAWDFIKNLPEDEKFELAVINPSYVTGPVLTDALAAGMEIPKRLLERGLLMVPKINFPIVDVRDVATAHLRAMVLPEAAGQRFICSNDNIWFADMAKMLAEEFDPQGYNVPTKLAPNAVLSFFAIFDSSIRLVVPVLGKVIKVDNSKMKNVLGIMGVDLKESVFSMVYTMIERGLIKKAKKYKGPPDGTHL